MKTLSIVKTDLKNVFRDPAMIAIFVLPLLLIALLRLVPPLYEAHFPEAIPFRPYILATFSLLISALSGFLMAFVLLDEKDQHLFDVFKTTPFTFERLIRLRILFMFGNGFFMCFLFMAGSGMIHLGILQMIVLAFLCALSGPANTLLIVSIANNKIEGSTYFKGLNMFIMAPLAAMFIVGPIKYLVGIIPFFWVFISFIEYQVPGSFYLHSVTGILYNGLYLFLAYRIFMKRTL